MKKIYLLLIVVLLPHSVFSSQFQISEGKQYITQKRVLTETPQIIEFFSFYCLPCYYFDEIMHLNNKIKNNIPIIKKVIKYHVDALGPLGKDLTHAWAVAIAFGIEDKISLPMFEAVQKNQSIKTSHDIRKVFLNIGINAVDYDAAWNSFTVKYWIEKQKKTARYFELKGAPVMFVNGKYRINPKGLDSSSIDTFIHQYIDTIKFLLEKN